MVHIHAGAAHQQQLSTQSVIKDRRVRIAGIACIVAIGVGLVGIGNVGTIVQTVFNAVIVMIGIGTTARHTAHTARAAGTTDTARAT